MKIKNYLKMFVLFAIFNFGLFLFPVVASANTAPKLEVIEDITIASTYPFDLKRLILEASDQEDTNLGKDDVQIEQYYFKSIDYSNPYANRVYNSSGTTYRIEFSLKDSEGLETKKESLIHVVVKQNLDRFHSSPNVLGKDTKYGNTTYETEVTYPLNYDKPYTFTFKYLSNQTKKPAEGLHLSFRKQGVVYTGSLGQTYFVTDDKGEYTFSLTKEQLAEYAGRITRVFKTGKIKDENLDYIQQFERYAYSIQPTSIYDAKAKADLNTAHYIFPDGYAQKFDIGLWGPKLNRIRFKTIDDVYEVEEGSEFFIGPQKTSAEQNKAQVNLKKLAKSFEYLFVDDETNELKWSSTLDNPRSMVRPMFRVSKGSVDTSKPGDYELTLQAGTLSNWGMQPEYSELGPEYYVIDNATIRVVARPVVTFKEIFKDKTVKKESSTKVSKGTKASQPEKPLKGEKDGKTVFMGWFKEDTFTNAFDFNKAITADTTVYGYWNHMPEIKTKDEIITEGDEFDLNKLVVSATDNEDGDLKASVEITDNGSFDNTKPGAYTVTFKVTDKDGISTTKTAKVTVEAKPVVTFKEAFKDKTEKKTTVVKVKKSEKVTSPESPKINDKDENTVFMGWFKEDTFKNAFDFNEAITGDTTVYGYWNHMPELKVKDMTITEGDEFDLKSLIVSATDTEDGDLIDKVEIIDNGGFDKNNAGTYTITFKLTDKDGTTSVKTAKLTIKKKAEKANPEGKNKTTPNTGIESSINKQIDLYTIISIIFATLFVLSKTVIKEN